MGSLFTDASLFFEVYKTKWVVLENSRETSSILWEDVQLLNLGRSQPKEPNLRFQLSGLAGRLEARRMTKDRGGWGCDCPVGVAVFGLYQTRCRGTCAECEDTGGAVIEAITAFQLNSHAQGSVVTVETDGARAIVLVPSHGPRRKDIARGKNGLGGDNGLTAFAE